MQATFRRKENVTGGWSVVIQDPPVAWNVGDVRTIQVTKASGDTEWVLVRIDNHEAYKKFECVIVKRYYDKYPTSKDTPHTQPKKQFNVTQDQLTNAVNAMAGVATQMIEDKFEELQAAAEKRITDAIENEAGKVRKVEINVVRKEGTKKLVGDTLPDEFETILELASIRQNILLTGPSGSGKTFLAGKVAEALDLPFSANSCSAGMSESQLAGWLLPVQKGGTFSYVASPFVRAYEEGGVHLLDEVDAADENTIIFINSALAGNEFYLPQRYDNPRVERHPDFQCIAASNTFGHGADAMYSGRNRMDAATMDRFRTGVVVIDYSDKVENALVNPEILRWGRAVRRCIMQHSLERVMSTRTLINMTQQVDELGWTPKKCKDIYFTDWSQDDMLQVQGVASL